MNDHLMYFLAGWILGALFAWKLTQFVHGYLYPRDLAKFVMDLPDKQRFELLSYKRRDK